MSEIQRHILNISEEQIENWKCPECKGSGEYIPPYEEGTATMDVYLICQKCKGTGALNIAIGKEQE